MNNDKLIMTTLHEIPGKKFEIVDIIFFTIFDYRNYLDGKDACLNNLKDEGIDAIVGITYAKGLVKRNGIGKRLKHNVLYALNTGLTGEICPGYIGTCVRFIK